MCIAIHEFCFPKKILKNLCVCVCVKFYFKLGETVVSTKKTY